VWGSVLAGHYVAANHFQDLLAHYRHRLGLPAVAINWGWWEGSEMVAPEAKAYFAAIGLDVIPEELGFCALERLLMSGDPQRTVAPVDWRTFKPVFSARRPRPLLDLIEVAQEQAGATELGAEGEALLRRLGPAPHARRCELVVEFLQPLVGAVLGRDPSQLIDPTIGFFEAGMDSIMSVQLKARLEQQLGVELATTAAFEHPNIASLAAHLVDDVLRLEDAQPEPQAPAGANGLNGSPGTAAALEGLSEDALLDLLVAELGPDEPS
jgi:acyl carrier protein